MQMHPLHDLHWSARLSTGARYLLSLAAALLIALAWPGRGVTHGLVAWCVFCIVDLALIWQLALRLDAGSTRRRAQHNDPGGAALFVLVLVAACASLVAVLMAVDTGRTLHGWARGWHLGLALLSLAGSWLLIQALFTLHYARAYYRPAEAPDAPARGLAFPGGQEPDYLDFAYFSAVIGMTSQVSDVAVQGRDMRRLALAHGLLSFAFNLVVLALAINVFAASMS